MARTRCQFTQEAMKRLLKAVVAAEARVRIEIETNGKIVILPVDGELVAAEIKSVPADIEM